MSILHLTVGQVVTIKGETIQGRIMVNQYGSEWYVSDIKGNKVYISCSLGFSVELDHNYSLMWLEDQKGKNRHELPEHDLRR